MKPDPVFDMKISFLISRLTAMVAEQENTVNGIAFGMKRAG